MAFEQLTLQERHRLGTIGDIYRSYKHDGSRGKLIDHFKKHFCFEIRDLNTFLLVNENSEKIVSPLIQKATYISNGELRPSNDMLASMFNAENDFNDQVFRKEPIEKTLENLEKGSFSHDITYGTNPPSLNMRDAEFWLRSYSFAKRVFGGMDLTPYMTEDGENFNFNGEVERRHRDLCKEMLGQSSSPNLLPTDYALASDRTRLWMIYCNPFQMKMSADLKDRLILHDYFIEMVRRQDKK